MEKVIFFFPKCDGKFYKFYLLMKITSKITVGYYSNKVHQYLRNVCRIFFLTLSILFIISEVFVVS